MRLIIHEKDHKEDRTQPHAEQATTRAQTPAPPGTSLEERSDGGNWVLEGAPSREGSGSEFLVSRRSIWAFQASFDTMTGQEP
jgi:hypothetical protein